MVLLDDPVADREPQPGPFADRLGGEERVEDPFADRRLDAAAGVGDVDPDALGLGLGTRADRDGIRPAVQASMAFMSRLTTTWWTLRRAAADRRQRLELRHQPNALLAGVALDHVHRRLDAGVQVDLVPVSLVDPGEEPQVLDDPLDPAQAFAGALDQLRQVVQGVVEVELLR